MNIFKSIFFYISLCALYPTVVVAETDMPVESFRAQGYEVSSISPVFSELVKFSIPTGFKVVFEKVNGPSYVREMVLDGENVNKWSQMITLTGFKGLSANPNVNPKKFLQGMAGGFKLACPNSFNGNPIFEGKISGHDSFVAVVSCGIAGQTSESVVIAVIQGEQDFYTLQWAERGALSSTPIPIEISKWEARLKQLAPIKFCAIVPGEVAPYPSCVNSK